MLSTIKRVHLTFWKILNTTCIFNNTHFTTAAARAYVKSKIKTTGMSSIRKPYYFLFYTRPKYYRW